MKHFLSICSFTLLSALAAAVPAVSSASTETQRKTCIDGGWQFALGDGSAAISQPAVGDSWRTLDLPHDWSIETEAAQQAGGTVVGPFSTNSIGKYQTGHTVGGEGWYMKTFKVANGQLTMNDAQWVIDDGLFSIYFEGAYNHSWVYVNGTLCHENVYGYSSFRVDITNRLQEGDNTILVRVSNEGSNSRWYAGSGIYRHVWLIRTPRLHADEWDAYIQGRVDGSLTVETGVCNEHATAASASVSVDIVDAQGTTVASGQTEVTVDPNSTQPSAINLHIANPRLWSPETPYLYLARITVTDGTDADVLEKRFGFRSLQFSAAEGFLLNGQPTLLRGGCVHHDNGLLGAAAFDKAERRKLQRIKALGYNAVRCSHNLPSENFLDVCDELGLMVVDECFDQWLVAKNPDDYHRYFRDHSSADIDVMLRRDRNHPSIVMWSIGNEIPGRVEPEGIATAERLRKAVLALDTTRPVTAAICSWDAGDAWNSSGHGWDIQDAQAFEFLDVGGYNYLYDKYEHDHGTHPDRVICGLESYPKLASENWSLVERLPYVIGDFVWTAMDYIGEAGIGAAYSDHAPSMFQDWPWFNGNCGDLDLIGQKKPQSYYRDVVWRQAPVTMAVQPLPSRNNAWGWQLEEQHWTWTGREGQEVAVNVYSRAPKVRLYLNGTPMGDRQPGTTFWTGYNIPYQPGTLRVVNLDEGGNEIAGEEFVLTTTGPAVAVRCVYEDAVLTEALNDLAYVTLELVDAEGHVVTSDCTTQITISNAGVGELIACGTGCPNDMKSFRSTMPTVFRGRALAIVRSNGVAGSVSLSADIVEQDEDFTSQILRNADFHEENLNGWTVSDPQYMKYNGTAWHGSKLDGFLECYSGWGAATTLAGMAASQTTCPLPAGNYTVTFDYNGTYYKNASNAYATDGALTGVTVSAGGGSVSVAAIDASSPLTSSFTFTLSEPQPVTFMLAFSDGTNASWFALDNVRLSYDGDLSAFDAIIDFTPAVGTSAADWPKVSGNASAAWSETKQGSAVYNGEGYAYWSASPPRNSKFFTHTIAHLPVGNYLLSAFAAASSWTGSDNNPSNQNQPGAYLFAGSSQTAVTTARYGSYSFLVTQHERGSLEIGMSAGNDNGNNWAYLSNVRLYKLDGLTLSENDPVPPLPCRGDVTLERTLTGGVWNTLVLPFDYAIPADWTVKVPTAFDEAVVTFGDALAMRAGKPYLVMPDHDISAIHATDANVAPALNATSVGELTMTGTFTPIDALPQGSYVVGVVDRVSSLYKVNSVVTLKPYRAYFNVAEGAAVKDEIIHMDFGDETGMTDMKSEKPGALYDLSGRRIPQSSIINNTLRKRIYIIGGKKVVVQ